MNQRKSNGISYFKNGLIKIMIFLLILTMGNFAQRSPKSALAFEIGRSSSEMTIVPDGMLFNIGNMAPGDKVTERLTVKNHEYFSFKYNLSSSLTDESLNSELFFNNLNLLIRDVRSDSVKYEGKLKDLTTIYFGSMLPKGQREYDCTLEFPTESGNEYQRLTTSFQFVVSAVQEESGGGDPSDPETPIVIPPETPTVIPSDPESPIVVSPITLPTTPVIIGLPDTGGKPLLHQAER